MDLNSPTKKAEQADAREKEKPIIYLYRNLFCVLQDGDEPNHFRINKYREVIQMTEHFVHSNIQDLVFLKKNQTDFQFLSKKL